MNTFQFFCLNLSTLCLTCKLPCHFDSLRCGHFENGNQTRVLLCKNIEVVSKLENKLYEQNKM